MTEKAVLQVEGMTCGHCVKAVTKAINALSGVTNVSVELAAKSATVIYDPAKCPIEKINMAIEDLGYEVTGHTLQS